MTKLYSLAFYALITSAITLGSGGLLVAQDSSENPDVGEQEMGQEATPETQNPEQDKEVTKSKYNTSEPTEQELGDEPDEQNKGDVDSPTANGDERPDEQ